MNTWIGLAFGLISLGTVWAQGQRQGAVTQSTGGVCSQAVIAGGNITITCQGLDAEQQESLKKIPNLIEQLLKRRQADRDAILAKLDELLKGMDDIRRQGPRKLDGVAAAQVVGAVAPFRGQKIEITAQVSDGEGSNLAEQLRQILTQAGWTATLNLAMLFPGKPVFGIAVSCAEQSPAALAILNAIHRAGLVVNGTLNQNLKDGLIQIVVWPKPQ